MHLCGDSDAFDLASPCVRGSWAALAPAVLVLAILLASIRVPLPDAVQKVSDAIKRPFTRFLTLTDAEALVAETEDKIPDAVEVAQEVDPAPLWRTIIFVFFGLLECLAWLANGSFILITGHSKWHAVQQFLIAGTWLYAVARPALRRTATPPFDLFALYIVHIFGGVLLLGGYLFQHNVSGAPLPGALVLVAFSANLAVLVGLVAVIMDMPLALPSRIVKKEDIVRHVP